MRIGVDIDGVLNYRTEILREQGTKFCVESGKGSLVAPERHHLREMFGWDQATRDEFWCRYGKYQMILVPAQTYAAEVLEKLRGEGHEIWIITGRNNQDQRVEGMSEGATWEEVTKDWLARNQIIYDGIAFDLGRPTPHDKATFCLERGIDVMIEDLPEYLMNFDERTKVLIYDQPYNQDVRLENSERVYTWYDVYSKIKKMES